MAVTIKNSAEGQTSGTAMTAANSGGGSGTAFDSLTLGGSGTAITYDNSQGGAYGSNAYKYALGTVSPAITVEWKATLAPSAIATAFGRMYLKLTSRASGSIDIMSFRSAAQYAAEVTLNTDGTLWVSRGQHGGVVITMTTVIPLNQWVRIEAKCTGHASAGVLECKLFLNQDDTTPTETGSATALNTIGTLEAIWFGNGLTNPNSYNFWVDELGASDTAYVGPDVSNVSVADTPSGARRGNSTSALHAVDDATGVQFVADANTPAYYTQYDQQQYLLPPALMTPLGSGPGSPAQLLGVWGYHQIGGPTGHQWLMSPILTQVLSNAIDNIPSVHQWGNSTSRTTFRTNAQTLLDTYRVGGPDVIALLAALFAATKANIHQTMTDHPNGSRDGGSPLVGITIPDVLIVDTPTWGRRSDSPTDVTVA